MADEVRLRSTGEVITIGQFRARHPQTAFPRPIKADTLDAYGADPVLSSPKPTTDRLHIARRNGVEQDAQGNWVETWETVERDVTLDALKAELKEEATVQFREHRDAGTIVTLNGSDIRIETTHSSQLELGRAAEKLAGTSDTLKAVTRSGARIVWDATTAAAARDAAANHYEACVTREYDLHEQIDAQTTKADVAAIDVTTGWPDD